MAQIIINIPDVVKTAWQAKCTARGASMTKLILAWIQRDIDLYGCDDIQVEVEPVHACKCLLCDFEWSARRESPAACPSCKSYRWNDADYQNSRIARAAAREQRQLYKEFEIELKRIGRLTQFGSTPEVARKIGTTPEKLSLYIKEINPLTRAQLDGLRRIQ